MQALRLILLLYFWAYASGFPKAGNISKMVDKKGANGFSKEICELFKNRIQELNLTKKDISKHFPSKTGRITGCVWNWLDGKNSPTIKQFNQLIKILQLEDNFDFIKEAQREIITQTNNGAKSIFGNLMNDSTLNITKSSSDQAKKLDGSYAGFQPKPAVEIILVVMKPLSEKNYVEQAMKNGKGITWLDGCRIPYKNEDDLHSTQERSNKSTLTSKDKFGGGYTKKLGEFGNTQGRFPANVICSDDALNDGKITKSPNSYIRKSNGFNQNDYGKGIGESIGKFSQNFNDSGSFSRYFDLDAWQAQFLIVEKASKSEKNLGLEDYTENTVNDGRKTSIDNPFQRGDSKRLNTHPTVKPISLMSYLISMGSREGDTILDPFAGSGTTLIAASLLNRNSIGIEREKLFCDIAQSRINYWKNHTFEKLQQIKKQAEKEKILKMEEFL